jgi:hypothetical protein
MHESYGEWIFLLVTLGAAVWGAWKGPQRYLHALILAWFLPLTVVVLWVSHFKFQYWLPVALPLFSSLVLLLPGKGSLGLSKLKLGNFKKLSVLVPLAALSVVVVQFFLFAWKDGLRVNSSLHRADNNPRIQFYGQASTALAPISSLSLHVYYDYRLYVPDTSGWSAETNYDLLEYGYIGQGDFDVLLLLEQRIRDYLAPDVTGIDPAYFALSQAFYRDAEAGSINGYHLVFRNSVGLVFVREDLYSRNYAP